MEKIIVFLILVIVILLLLCIAAALLIIKMLKPQNDFRLVFKRDSRLYKLAFKDDLTDLFNRNAYIRDLRTFRRKKSKMLWFSIYDIDDFKKINDTMGHLYGDKILKLAANRLSEVFNDKNHTIYRIGGDEFLVISKDISEDELVNYLLKLRDIEIKKSDFRFSKGYSFVANNGSQGFDVGFENADQMLYADKKGKTDRSKRL